MPAPIFPLLARLMGGVAARGAVARTTVTGAGRAAAASAKRGVQAVKSARARRAAVAQSTGGQAAAAGAKRPAINYSQLLTQGMGKGQTESIQFKQKVNQEQRDYDDHKGVMEDELAAREKVTGSLKNMAKYSVGAITAFGAVYYGMFKLPAALKKWGESLAESKRGLSHFSGTIAASLSKLDVQRIQLGVKTARGTESTAKAQLAAQHRFNQRYSKLEILTTNVGNKIREAIIDGASLVVEHLGLISPKISLIAKLLEWWVGEEQNKPDEDALRAQTWINEIKSGKGVRPGRTPLPPIR